MNDTIAAIATPPGPSGIGIIRVSGPLCSRVAEKVFRPLKGSHPLASHRLSYGHVVAPSDGSTIDEVLAVLMKAPKTYTREDCLEIQSHGGTSVLREILETVISLGARLAQPGEFTLRAFLNGRIDLTQAEAVVDVIQARSRSGSRLAQRQLQGGLSVIIHQVQEDLVECLTCLEAAIDFPDEQIPDPSLDELLGILSESVSRLDRLINSYTQGRVCREGASIMIVGATNVGKSTLFNAMLGFERAIVTPVPGTTRDLVEDWMEWEGMPIRAIDTAGLREISDAIEREGHRLLLERMPQVDLIVWVIDASRPMEPIMDPVEQFIEGIPVIVVLNKIDLPRAISEDELPTFLKGRPVVETCGINGTGVGELLDSARDLLIGSSDMDDLLLTNVRHKTLLERGREHILAARSLLEESGYIELTATDLHDALKCVQQLLGHCADEELLDRIFTRFCIGK